ncbi:endopeptidase La [Salinispira pacifica]|uniref:Lon protease n=1 Tax=Salinispira pacifica TaxID=1307761 RepID=V5WGW9_9SPIO|nr:endopeptidase La [Salinispira pacifica]AHC15018.1 ATP-dependent protease LaType I [Salinispira pacifica]
MSKFEIAPLELSLPQKLRIVPMTGKPIFPGIFTPLMISSDEDKAAVEEAVESDGHVGLVLTRTAEQEQPGFEELYQIGTVAKIVKRINLPDGGINVFISTIRRFKIKKPIQSAPSLIAAVEYIDDDYEDSNEIKAMARSLLTEIKQISEGNPLFSEEMRLNMVNIDHPGKIADFITSILNIDRDEQQGVLETLDIQDRMEKVLVFLKNEKELLRIQKKIQSQINEKIEKSQREYFLKEQLKTIKEELGIAVDGKSEELNRLEEAIEALQLPEDVREQVDKELHKFSLMDPNTSDYHVTRNYLDTIVSLPWNDPEHKEIDMKKASKILNADHYGLEDVKERILEFLAVHKKKKDFKGSIILLVGPPGVGKTSIGKSVARSLGKEFFRFSVGGMRDEAEIKGHRRTYVGAMPGKIIQGLKIVKSKDPVFMIDEIDKLGASFQGDPSSALLEVLDPEQNISFRDHYLDLPFDVSQVLFIVTANTLDSIPRPLLDRMEVIRLSGYIAQEKVAIAKKYIIPKSLEKNGLDKKEVSFKKNALQKIAEGYAREAGMRNYEKAVNKINRKIATKLVMEEAETPVEIDESNLPDYLGQPFFREEDRKILKPGMVTGLAWTNFGGDTLIIETVATKGRENFKLTGQMGKVMQESANIAYTWVKKNLEDQKDTEGFFSEHTVHIHIPAGATPKDGPSAGITMASALLSLARNRKIRKRLGMTGELSLSGSVLPIGGLKEKTIAAKRAKVKEIIIPKANERDLAEIPEHITRGITFYPVEHMEEVLEILFPKK